MKQKTKSNDRLVPAALALLLLALALFLFQEGQEENRPGSAEFQSQLDERVNSHLHDTDRKIHLRETESRLATEKDLIQDEKSKPQKPYQFNPNRLEIAEYQARHQFNEDVGRGQKPVALPEDPSQWVQTQLFNDQVDEQYTEDFKKEYTRQFIENAKKGGWDIRVDSTFRVIHARPFGRQKNLNLFNGEGAGSR